MRTIAVTSGKGGVGKTNLAVNIGMALAALGRRVLVVDGDIGLANLDVVLGVRPPHTLQQVLREEVSLEQALFPVPGGIKVLAGGSGAESLVEIRGPLADRFLTQLQELSTSLDDLIIDTGAGIDSNVMLFLEAADIVLLIATPDPASLTDVYATAKALHMRQNGADMRLVVNMVSDERQARSVHDRLCDVARQFLGKAFPFAGYVRADDKALALIRARRPFFAADGNIPASRDVLNVARTLAGERKPSKAAGIIERLRSIWSTEDRLAS